MTIDLILGLVGFILAVVMAIAGFILLKNGKKD